MDAPSRSGGNPTRIRIGNLQLLRFIAAAGVLISHAADLLIPHDVTHRWFWAIPWTAGVDLFFVISGFVMLWLTYDDFGRGGVARTFLVRRLVRIAPAYWFFTTLTVIAVLGMGGHLKGTSVDPAQLVTSYGFLPWPRADGRINPILAQGWTLNHEAFFYTLFAVALLVRRGPMLLYAALLLLAVVHPLVPQSWFMAEFWTRPIILEFAAGLLLAQLYHAGVRLPPASAFFGLALAVGIFVLIRTIGLGGIRFLQAGLPATIIAASVILTPEPKTSGPIRQMVERGGDASYTLYLAHYMIVNAVALVWLRLHIGLPWLGVMTGIVLSIGFAFVFFEQIERPITHWLQGRIVPPRASRLEDVAP